MTIDEAIRHCEEVAECNEIAGLESEARRQCCNDHRQLAKWLTELKELRNSIGAVKLKDMKEAVGLLQELNTENDRLTSQLVDAKRLLKLAVEDMNDNEICYDINACNVCTQANKVSCDTFKWRYTDEALKLIGGETDEHS